MSERKRLTLTTEESRLLRLILRSYVGEDIIEWNDRNVAEIPIFDPDDFEGWVETEDFSETPFADALDALDGQHFEGGFDEFRIATGCVLTACNERLDLVHSFEEPTAGISLFEKFQYALTQFEQMQADIMEYRDDLRAIDERAYRLYRGP